MKQKIVRIITDILEILFSIFYRRPKYTITLPFNQHLWIQDSYYPEHKRKSRVRIIFDLLSQIWKYGAPNEYYFLYGLDVKYGSDYRSYIHYTPFMKQRDKLNLSSDHNSSCILRNKLYFGIFAKSIGIATPENIAYINNGDVLLLNTASHTNIKDFATNLNGTFFCKPVDGECGKGVFKLDVTSDKILINNAIVTFEDLTDALNGTAFIIQKCITQHPLQAKLHPSSINSMRMVTVRSLKDGHIEVLPSILRIGANGSIVDNTSQGGIAVGFDPNTGHLNEYGFFKPEFGLRTNTHPNSNIKFSEYTIPHIKEAVEQAKYFHSLLDLHSIGWDIAIGEDGPIFIEGNDNWEINGPQSCNRGLAKEYYNLFFK